MRWRDCNIRMLSGWCMLATMAGAALAAPVIMPNDPLVTDLDHRLHPPGPEFILGTDQLGRCILSRVVYGARISLSGAGAAALIAMAAGTAVGIGAALSRGRAALLLTAVIDMGLALPGLVLTLVIAGLLGGNMQGLVLGLALANWPWWARLVRGLTLTAREKEYVLAGRVAGLSRFRLVSAYIIPQISGPVLAAGAMKTGRMILVFSGLCYLGLGPAPPAPEWGRMIQESGLYMIQAPWLMLAPGIAVTLTVMALNLIAGQGEAT